MYELPKTSELGLSGSVVNGRVLLDPLGADQLFATTTAGEPTDPGTDHIDPGGTFIAVNAPFDPQSVAVETEELAEV